LEFLVQERFRKPKYSNYRDITITEWNTITNLPSELYKLNAGLFVYGYADNWPNPSDFIEVVVVDTARMIINIIRDDFICGLEENPRTEQTFITIPFVLLFDAGCVVSTYRRLDRNETQTPIPMFDTG